MPRMIRPFADGDAPHLEPVLRTLGWDERYVRGQLRAVAGLASSPDGQVFVAELEGAVRGFASVEGHEWNGLARLHGLAVAPSHRRRGLASALLEAVEGWAQAASLRGVWLDTPDDNWPAQSFYAARGYVEGNVLRRYYADDLDGLTFWKFFGDAAPKAVTRSQLVAGLERLGVRPGATLMVHTRMSAFGWVAGGADAVVLALLDLLGESGTLVAMCGWADDAYDLEDWPAERREAYLADPPGFVPERSEGSPENGWLPERLRTWPGAVPSRHPEARFVAVGPRAAWLVAEHPWDDAYGPGSPLAKLVELDGEVLLLGAPLETTTLLHHAEALARVPDKRRVRYRMPLLTGEGVTWREFSDIDSSEGIVPYEDVVGEGVDGFAAIAGDALAAGVGRSGEVAGAASHLLPARELVAFAMEWLEARFGEDARQQRT